MSAAAGDVHGHLPSSVHRPQSDPAAASTSRHPAHGVSHRPRYLRLWYRYRAGEFSPRWVRGRDLQQWTAACAIGWVEYARPTGLTVGLADSTHPTNRP